MLTTPLFTSESQRSSRSGIGLVTVLTVLRHPHLLFRFEEAFVGRGSPDPARVPDRRSPSFGACFESRNAFEARAYGERGRPSVRHSGGVGRPAPNIRLSAQGGARRATRPQPVAEAQTEDLADAVIDPA